MDRSFLQFDLILRIQDFINEHNLYHNSKEHENR